MSFSALLAILAVPFALFIPLSWRKAIASSQTFVDDHIPFIPVFVLPYFSFFLLIPLTLFVVIPTPWGRECVTALIVAMWTGALVWYFIPTSIVRPPVPGTGPFSRIVKWMYRVDGPSNNFPSSHVFISLLCGYYLAQAMPEWSLIAWLWAVLSASSTVFVKQHYVADIFGGVVWAVSSVMLAQWLLS
jgi:membrane-associated phospholipid phosphatase